MSVTMREIDALRDRCGALLEEYRAMKRAAEACRLDATYVTNAKKLLDDARVLVNAALQQWWAQDCTEPPTDPGAYAPQPRGKPDCACTVFDDGSEFCLSAFAGGAAPDGAYSYIRCIEKKPDGSQTMHYYDAGSSVDETLLRQMAWALRDLLLTSGQASDDAICHAGLTRRTACGRCSRIDRANRVLAKIPRHLLDPDIRPEGVL